MRGSRVTFIPTANPLKTKRASRISGYTVRARTNTVPSTPATTPTAQARRGSASCSGQGVLH
eukprot:scaffold46577_cov105-Phaeocystis_antarctica.AAC.3